MCKRTIASLFGFAALFLLGSVSVADRGLLKSPESVPAYEPKFYPYAEGEKAVYKATWNGLVSVATAVIYTTRTVVDGKDVYHVRVEAQTSRVLDLIWRMRDTISSTFVAGGLSPLRFTFNQRENSRIIDTEARYNSSTNRWVVSRRQAGKKTKKYEFDSQHTVDPITAVYLARSVEYKVGDRLYFNVFGGRHRYLLELYVARKEPVEMESGRVIEAFRIVPRVRNVTKKGYAQRFNEAAVWISADERRLPVKMSSKIVFGSIYLELIQDKTGVPSTASDSRRPASRSIPRDISDAMLNRPAHAAALPN
jgi:hypothetical protein